MKIRKYFRVIILLVEGAFLCFGTACGSREGSLSEEQAGTETEGMAEAPDRGQEAADMAEFPAVEPGAAIMAELSAGEPGAAIMADWTEKQLIQADFLMYNVDCASEAPDIFPEGQICGLCQSVSDRLYGEDSGSGRVWGYREADYLIREQDSLGEGLTASKWSMDENLYQGGEDSAICYD